MGKDSVGRLVTLAHCIEQGGTHVEARHLETQLGCATIRATASPFLARGAEACARCAETCERMAAMAM